MRNWLGIGLTLGLVTALPLACSSSPPIPFQTVDSFCTAKAQAECNKVAPVCAIETSTCQQARDVLCQEQAAAATAPPSTREYFQPNAQACLTKITSAYGSGNEVAASDLFGTGSIDDLCNRVFQGKADKNVACTSNYDCTNGGICSPEAPGSSMSVCAVAEPTSAGDFCANPGSVCATGTYCANIMGGAPQCTARQTMGQACTATSPCLETLRCVAGACAARQALGKPCSTNDDCSSDGPYCDPSAGGICTIGLTFATGSDDCTAYSGATPPVVQVDSGAPAEAAAPTEAGPSDAAGGG